jgi:hypothetical protein
MGVRIVPRAGRRLAVVDERRLVGWTGVLTVERLVAVVESCGDFEMAVWGSTVLRTRAGLWYRSTTTTTLLYSKLK